ncbi:MAG: hypothetical protein ABFC94_01435 [Syntrophomonas sp.]
MKSNLLVIFLMAIILALIIPMTIGRYGTENAFTQGNFINVQTVSTTQAP